MLNRLRGSASGINLAFTRGRYSRPCVAGLVFGEYSPSELGSNEGKENPPLIAQRRVTMPALAGNSTSAESRLVTAFA